MPSPAGRYSDSQPRTLHPTQGPCLPRWLGMKRGSHLVRYPWIHPSRPSQAVLPLLSLPTGNPTDLHIFLSSPPLSILSPPPLDPPPRPPRNPVSKKPVGTCWVRPSTTPCRASRQTFREVDPPRPASPSAPLSIPSSRVPLPPLPSHHPSPPRPHPTPTPSKPTITSTSQLRHRPPKSRSTSRARHTPHTLSPLRPANARSSRRKPPSRPNARAASRAASNTAHGTVPGSWFGSQLTCALNAIFDHNHTLLRMPGSGLHRQVKVCWNGYRLAVNIWDTGRVHVQGIGASHFALLLANTLGSATTAMPAPSRSPGLSESPSICNSDSDPPGQACALISRCKHSKRRAGCVCSLFSSLGGLVLPWFTYVMVATFGFLWRLFGGISHTGSRFLVSFIGMPFPLRPWRQRRRRHKRIRGIGSQGASRRGAKPRLSVSFFKARPHQVSFLCRALASRYVFMPSRPRSSFFAAAVMGMILGLCIGLHRQGHFECLLVHVRSRQFLLFSPSLFLPRSQSRVSFAWPSHP